MVVTAGLALAVVALAAAWNWQRLRESLHLQRLGSSDLDTQADAARHLGDLRSLCAIPRLVKLAARGLGHPEASPVGVVSIEALTALAILGEPGIDAVDRKRLDWDAWMRRGLLTFVLSKGEALKAFRPMLVQWILEIPNELNGATCKALADLQGVSFEEILEALPAGRVDLGEALNSF